MGSEPVQYSTEPVLHPSPSSSSGGILSTLVCEGIREAQTNSRSVLQAGFSVDGLIASPGNLFEMQFLWTYLIPAESEPLGMGWQLGFKEPSR